MACAANQINNLQRGWGRKVSKMGQAVGIVVAAKELGLVEQTLRNWVKASAAGKLTTPGAKLVTPEQMELSRLRAENARLKMHVDILKKATAYFAKDAL